MNAEHHRSYKGRWVVVIVCVLLLALAAGGFILVRSHPRRSDLMTLDSDGTMRLGTVPLRNTNVRNAALTVVSHLNNGTIAFTSTGAVTISNLAGTLQELHRAGATNVIFRVGGVVVDQKAK